MKKSAKKILPIFFVVGLVMLISGVALALFTYNASTGLIYSVNGGSIRMNFRDNITSTYTANAYIPMTLNEALNHVEPTTFEISTMNTTDKYLIYSINLEIPGGSSYFPKSELSYALVRNGEIISEGSSIPQSGKIAVEKIAPNKNQTNDINYSYELYVWVRYLVSINDGTVNSYVYKNYTSGEYANKFISYKIYVDGKDTNYVNYHCKEGSYYCPPTTILDGKDDHIFKASPFYTDANYDYTFIGYASSQEKADNWIVEYYPGDPIPAVTDLYAVYTSGCYSMYQLSLSDSVLNTITKVVYKYIKEDDFIKEASVPDNVYSSNAIGIQLSNSRPVYCWINGTTLYVGAEGQLTHWIFFRANSRSNNIISEIEISNFSPFNMRQSDRIFYYSKMESIDLEFFAYGTIKQSFFDTCPNLKHIDLSMCDKLKVISMQYFCDGAQSLETVKFPNHLMNIGSTLARSFYNCKKITEIDLSMFDTSTLTNISSTFYDCEVLRTIYVGKYFDNSNINSSNSSYYSASTLTGGAGTILYDLQNISNLAGAEYLEYFRIDSIGSPGVLTYKEL